MARPSKERRVTGSLIMMRLVNLFLFAMAVLFVVCVILGGPHQ